MASYTLTYTEEQIEIVKGLLEQELQTARTELRRTRNPAYRDRVQHRIDMVELILTSIEHVKHPAEPSELAGLA